VKVHKRYNKLIDSGAPIQRRIVICIPLTGIVRAEWMMARYGQTIPVNWANAEIIQWIDTYSPMSHSVADARNMCVKHAVEQNFEWLLFIDHDVILPHNTFIKMNSYIHQGDIPVVCGWYNAKGVPPEPLLFRGRGNSYYRNFKPGDKVWVDGVPMGCTLINGKLLKAMYDESPVYRNINGQDIRQVFHTPRFSEVNASGGFMSQSGTEDLWWCDRVIKEGWLKRTGFKEAAKKKYPFLCDTSIRCGHIDNSGRVY
jgi:hypothetical protein